MPRQPIRSLIDRAIERSDKIVDFTAIPILFHTRGQELPGPPEGDEELQHIPSDFSNEKVVAVWHTPEAIEVALSNGMRVSIETAPLTMAMKIYPASYERDESAVLLTLIRHDEDLPSTAQLVERRTRALRQLYAIGIITQNAERYVPRLQEVQVGTNFDYEDVLDPDERLVLRSAGEGTWWTVVKSFGVLLGKAPKTTLVFLTTVLEGGKARTQKYVDAHVQATQALADRSTAEAAGLQIQNRIAEQAAIEEPERARIETRKQEVAVSKEEVELAGAEFAEQKKKADAFLDYVDRLENIKDPDIRAKLKAELMQSSRELIGPVADKWLQLPSSKN